MKFTFSFLKNIWKERKYTSCKLSECYKNLQFNENTFILKSKKGNCAKIINWDFMTWNHLHTSSVERPSKLFHVTIWQWTVLSHLPLSIRNELKMNKYTRFNNNKHFRGAEYIVRALARKSLTDMSGWSCPYGILSRYMAIARNKHSKLCKYSSRTLGIKTHL